MTGRISEDPVATTLVGVAYAAAQGGINVQVPQTLVSASFVTTATVAVTAGKVLSVSNTMTLAGTDSQVITFQGTGTYVHRSSTDTLTNKTYDTGGSGNSFSIDGPASQGDIAYYNSTKWTRLAAGSSGTFLKTLGAGANPTWAPAALTVGSSPVTGGTSTRVLFDNAGTLGEYTISGSGSVAMTTSPQFTTDIRPSSDDGASLGIAGTAFSDLFLASGGVANWANGNVTITHSSNTLTVATDTFQLQSATSLFPKSIVTNTTNDANGPYFVVRKDRAGGAIQVGDSVGTFLFQGRDSSGTPTIRNAAFLAATVASVTSGTVTANFNLTAGAASWQFNANSQTVVPGGFSRGNPVTKTADFTVADTDSWLINNKAGSTCTVTMPAAASYPGRELMFKNLQAQTVVSNASNIVPQAGGAAGTALLASGSSHWCIVVSDGTNWITMFSA